MTLRVATLNIWNKSGPWLDRMALLADELKTLHADLVGLQEVLELQTPRGTQNQCSEICGDYHWVYGVGHEMSGPFIPKDGKLLFGNALLSRYPIRRHEVIPLPGTALSDQERSLLHAVVDAPFGPLHVFVTHLNWKLDEGWVRERQVVAIADAVRARADESAFPALLMGDMNAEPDSDEIRYLRGMTRLGQARSTRFADVWEYTRDHREQQLGYTFDGKRNPYAATYSEPPRRIDYIFVHGPGRHGNGRPEHVSLAFEASRGGVRCSDHYGLVADLHAPETKPSSPKR